MSMILDALSRAEQERRSENDVILDPTRYVGTSSIKEQRLKKWIFLALLINIALVMAFLVGYIWNNNSPSNATNMVSKNQPAKVQTPNPKATATSSTDTSLALTAKIEPTVAINPAVSKQPNLSNGPTLSLQEEAKVATLANRKVNNKKKIPKVVKKNPPVRYAMQPLSKPSTPDIPVAPALQPSAEKYLPASDLPAAERSRLSQYEINVHVYDSNVRNRFVLINMTKYKEGDRLPGGGPLIAAITPEGVVVDTGSGKALLERNSH